MGMDDVMMEIIRRLSQLERRLERSAVVEEGGGGISAHSSDLVLMPKIGSPIIDTLTGDFTTRGSSGVIDGTLTYVQVDTGSHKVKVIAGEGYLRIANDQQAALKTITWPLTTQIDIPAPAAGQETVRFIGVEYNAGTPQVTTRNTFNWNWFDDFPLARVSYDGTTLRILNAYAHAEDITNAARRYLRLTHPFIREEAPEGSGGLEISDVATRQLAMTAGTIWHGFNRYVLSAVTAGTAFDTHYRRSGGGFNSTTGVTQWPDTQFDNGSGTLATMTNNKYACLWVYVDVSDGSLDIIYGRDEYTSVSNAQAEEVPTTPDHLTYHGRLIGRIIFQKAASAASLVESAWRSGFTPSVVGDHTLLSNLNSTNYSHPTAAQLTDLTDGGDTTLHIHDSRYYTESEIDIRLPRLSAIPGREFPLQGVYGTDGISQHFIDDTATYPANWTQSDAALTVDTNVFYGFWRLTGNSSETSWKYRRQSSINLESLGADVYASFLFGPILFRDGGFTADLHYYFGIYRNNAGAIDENTFSRIDLYWNSASAVWQVRAEEKDGTTQHNSSYKTLSFPYQEPLYFRVAARNSAAKLARGYMGTLPVAESQTLLLSQNPSAAPTWGQIWAQIHMSRGAGVGDTLILGAVDYSNDA